LDGITARFVRCDKKRAAMLRDASLILNRR